MYLNVREFCKWHWGSAVLRRFHPAISPRCRRIAHPASEPPFLVGAVLSVILRRSILFYCHGRGLARAGIALPWHWGLPGWEMCHTLTMAAGLQHCLVFSGVPRSADFLVKEFPSCKWQGSSGLPFGSEVRCSIRKAIDRILLWIRRQYVCPKHLYPFTRPHGVINQHNI